MLEWHEVSVVLATGRKMQRAAKSFGGQASKGIRRMPWRQEAMKDVVSCEKPRGAASKRRSVGLRMGKPAPSNVGVTRD